MIASGRAARGVGRPDFGVGIGHGEDDRLLGHGLDHLGLERAGRRQAEEHVGALQRLGQRPLVGFDRMRRLPLVEVGARLVDHALAVAHDDMVAAHAHRLDQLGAGDRGGAGAVHHDADVAELALGQLAGVDQARGGDDRGAVLVVVEHRNVHPLAQRLLDDEAVGRGNVLEVDAAEARLEQLDRSR